MQSSVKMVVAVLAAVPAMAATAASHTVRVGGGGLTFNPSTLTIQQGDTVAFTNAGGVHNIVADDGSFRCAGGCTSGGSTGDPSGSAWTTVLTFDRPGTVGYYCEPHGGPNFGMAGRIIVEGLQPTFRVVPAISGNWFDPAQSGHGFQFEVLSATSMSAFWFTFDNAGNAAWIAGVGTIVDDRVVVEARRVTGGRFPPNFNPANIQAPVWGTLTFTFTGCNAGRVNWTTTDPAYTASGTMPLTRSTQIAGTVCE